MTETVIARRKALRYLGLLATTAAGRDFLSAWLPSASGATHGAHHAEPRDEPPGPYSPKFFGPDDFRTVETLAEMIIPTDDKPGARKARVADYIDFVVFSAAEFEPSLQNDWTTGLALLDRMSRKEIGRAFREAAAADRERLLTEISLPEREPGRSPTDPAFAFYRLVKSMTVEAFYSSRLGLIEVLEYQGLTYLTEFPGCTHPEHQDH